MRRSGRVLVVRPLSFYVQRGRERMWPLNLIRIKKAAGDVIEHERIVASTVASRIAGPQTLKTEEIAMEAVGMFEPIVDFIDPLERGERIIRLARISI